MGTLVQVAIVVCVLIAWLVFLYLYETRQVKRDLRKSAAPAKGAAREGSVPGD